MNEKNKSGIIAIVLLSTFFGLVAGIVGSLTVKSYFGTSTAFWGEFDFVNGNLDKPNVIISGAKKVVVGQDEKINETISQVSNSLMGIYNKKASSTKKDLVDLDNFYVLGEEIGTGLIITSDGWMVTDALDSSDFTKDNFKTNIEKYVLISKNGDIYNIDKAVVDPETDFVFFHINARDLPVLNLAIKNELRPGETVFSTNVSGENFISNISSSRVNSDYTSMSSDFYYDKISLVDKLDESFNSSYIFNIGGEVIMFVDKKGNLIPTRVFNSTIKSLFQKEMITRPSLGLVYADLSYLISSTKDDTFLDAGALVLPSPKSTLLPWVKAGIEAGDIIKYIDGIKLDKENNLTKILMDYQPGNKIKLGLLRGTEEMEITVELAELK